MLSDMSTKSIFYLFFETFPNIKLQLLLYNFLFFAIDYFNLKLHWVYLEFFNTVFIYFLPFQKLF